MGKRILVAAYALAVAAAIHACSVNDVTPSDGGVDSSFVDSASDAALDVAVTDAGGDADAGDGSLPHAQSGQSCADGGLGLSNCGPTGIESCCATITIPGGNFFRSYDNDAYTDAGSPASISTFALDKYLVTVGRFRQFVNASAAGWQPMASSGTHSYLNADAGLANTAAPGNFETGWSATWDAQLATTVGGWNVNLGCGSADQTWSNSPNSANENLPILCADWYEAYAFCIWDGGFLPSEAEWNYAAAGGSDQRAYPWSSPPTSLTIDCFHAICNGCGASNNVGSESPVGDGKWGHTDLAGNAFEWTLDAFGAYVTPCTDCAYLLAAPSGRSTRSASNCSPASWALSSYRTSLPATNRGLGFGGGCGTGLRCARAP